MNHGRKLFVKEHKGEWCNGFRSRRWYSHGFEFSLRIPRSRSGNFYPILLGFIRSESEERAKLFNLLYTKGLTTEQIGEISDEFMDVLILTWTEEHSTSGALQT